MVLRSPAAARAMVGGMNIERKGAFVAARDRFIYSTGRWLQTF
jgi:hypothetical protein